MIANDPRAQTAALGPRKTFALGLLRKRAILLPSWKGVLFLFGVFALAAFLLLTQVHPFLAPNDPLAAEVLVVEGWASDYAIEEAVADYRRGNYRALYVTGGPIEKGAPFAEWGTLADLGAATIRKLHPDLANVVAVSSPDVRQDRTYASAVALRDYLRERNKMPRQLNLFSVGPHARRSRLLFQQAFGPDVNVGVISIVDRTYDPKRWWASSAGFRTVIGELIAYGYARLLFRPE